MYDGTNHVVFDGGFFFHRIGTNKSPSPVRWASENGLLGAGSSALTWRARRR